MKKQKMPIALPTHWSPDAVALFRRLFRDKCVTTQSAAETLAQAIEAHQRAESCRQRIAADGELIKDRFGHAKPHPLLTPERQARALFAKLLGSLPNPTDFLRERWNAANRGEGDE